MSTKSTAQKSSIAWKLMSASMPQYCTVLYWPGSWHQRPRNATLLCGTNSGHADIVMSCLRTPWWAACNTWTRSSKALSTLSYMCAHAHLKRWVLHHWECLQQCPHSCRLLLTPSCQLQQIYMRLVLWILFVWGLTACEAVVAWCHFCSRPSDKPTDQLVRQTHQTRFQSDWTKLLIFKRTVVRQCSLIVWLCSAC